MARCPAFNKDRPRQFAQLCNLIFDFSRRLHGLPALGLDPVPPRSVAIDAARNIETMPIG